LIVAALRRFGSKCTLLNNFELLVSHQPKDSLFSTRNSFAQKALLNATPTEGTPATFAGLDQMLADSSRPIQDLWTEMLTYHHINGRNHPVASASSLKQIQSWRRAKIWRTLAQLNRKIADVRCAIISAQQLRLAKSLISEIVSGGIQ
jgi:hypothetical protein